MKIEQHREDLSPVVQRADNLRLPYTFRGVLVQVMLRVRFEL